MPTLLVFGARHLGRVLAGEFAADGWRIAGVARTEETIRLLVEDVPAAVGVIADASKPNDVERVFADVGDVDLIVSAITTTPRYGGPIHEAPPDGLEPYMTELLPAIFNILRVGGRVLAERGRGTLVQVTGGSARR
ncbi:MAG TPA: SDR family oxidoreductase, partial [Gaiellaceae bacterium]|nr:SDR family oxidoreductase [Gaiellaceae bacterium]